MLEFEYVYILYGLIIIPVLVVVFIIISINKRKRLNKFGDISLINGLMPDFSSTRPVVKFVFFLIALSFFIVGLSDPKIGSKIKEAKREGIELIIALDVSRSMLSEDIKPSRLDNAKRAISKLIDKLQNDRIGLIVFAGDAYVQLPITTDYGAAKLFLANISPELVPVQGTAIGKAIDLATHSFTPEAEKNRAIVVITDGENHEDDAVKSATAASEMGIFVHAIGLGKPEGVPIPEKGKFGRKDFHLDNEGNVVISKLNEAELQRIAIAGKGTYIRANSNRTGLDKIFEEIEKMEKQEYESKSFEEYDDKFQYFIGIAVFFLILEFMVLDRKNKWLKKIDLFKTNNL